MQDYLSSGFAPALSDNFAPGPSANFASNQYDVIHMLAIQSELPKPSNRREFIFQQERKIKNDFLRKPDSKSMPLIPTQRFVETPLQRLKVNGKRDSSALRLKIIASAVAVGLVVFAAQLGCSSVHQQLASHEIHQSSPGHSGVATKFNNSTASSVDSSATTTDGAPATTAMSDNTLDQAHKIGLIAVAQAATVAATAEPTKAIQNFSAPTSDVNNLILSKINTVNLVKIGYDRLRTGSAQESVSILSEAVRRDHNDPTSRRYLGYALIKAGRPSEALAQYDALQKLSGLLPSDRLAMQHAMRISQANGVSVESGDNDTLISKYRAAILLNPKDFDSKYDLAVMCSKMGRTEEAIHECLTGISEAPSCSEKQQKFYQLYASLATSNSNRS